MTAAVRKKAHKVETVSQTLPQFRQVMRRSPAGSRGSPRRVNCCGRSRSFGPATRTPW